MNTQHHVLFLRGLNDNGITRILKITGNNQLIYTCKGSCNVFQHIGSDQFSNQLITLDSNKEQDIQYADTRLIFNQISNADTHKIALSKATKLCDTLKDGTVCINHPSKVVALTRDHLAECLDGVNGIDVPKTIRFTPSAASQISEKIAELSWVYPVIIHQCGDHNGQNMERLDTSADVEKLSYTYFRNECYLTQFIDYADDNGIYRKVRLVVVDGEVFIRHVLYNDNWKVTAGARNFMKNNSWYYDYEKTLIESFNAEIKPRINDAVRGIHQAVELDYYGIDCALDNELNLLIFEINPDMNILHNNAPLPSIWAPLIGDIKQKLVKMITERLS